MFDPGNVAILFTTCNSRSGGILTCVKQWVSDSIIVKKVNVKDRV